MNAQNVNGITGTISKSIDMIQQVVEAHMYVLTFSCFGNGTAPLYIENISVVILQFI